MKNKNKLFYALLVATGLAVGGKSIASSVGTAKIMNYREFSNHGLLDHSTKKFYDELSFKVDKLNNPKIGKSINSMAVETEAERKGLDFGFYDAEDYSSNLEMDSIPNYVETEAERKNSSVDESYIRK